MLRRHGWNATSFQVLEPEFRYWFPEGSGASEADACVAYVDTGRAWVAGGAPIAAREQVIPVAEAFVRAARAAGRRASFFAIEPRFSDRSPFQRLHVGEQPVWVPSEWEATLKGSRSLREQLRRARAKGVSVRRVSSEELGEAPGSTRQAIEALLAGWLATRPMAPMGFLVQLHLFGFPEERRLFVAEQGGRLVAFLNAVPVYGRSGWFLEDLLRSGEAPNGSAELLVDAAMRAAAAEGAPYLTLGMVPLAGALARPLRLARWLGSALYDFEGLRAFKAKLRPQRWDPIYLSYPREQTAASALYDTLAAFSRGGLLRFGLRTLLRGPTLLLRLMALLLVPWTLALLLAPGRQWFPSRGVQWGWVLFDALVAPALYALSVRWRPRLALGLAVAVTADALLTLTQALSFNLPRVRGVVDAGIVLASLAAPTFAAFLLWRARAHRARALPSAPAG
nr:MULTISPECIES: DUF2156 domain-containing protein [Myxococcaceae]